MAINELRSITTFIKAAELGSLRKAALELGISPQAASKALAQLEAHLDARLFHRTTRVMSLTDAGQRLFEDVQPSVLGMQRALETARSAKDEFAGPLRITGPRTTFQHILWRLVEEFCDMHPGIQPDVLLDDRIGNWVEDRVDVGFRLGPSPHEGVIARRLFPVQLPICGAPSYFEQYGMPGSLTDLASHRCSAYRHPSTGKVLPWRVKLGDEPADQPVVPTICSNDELFELQAVLAGKVLGQLAGITAAPYIRSGQLIPVLGDHMPNYASYFVYFGSRSSQPVRARAFIDLAVQRLSDSSEYVLTEKDLQAGRRRGRAVGRSARHGSS
ncbi:LysR family transcriptional regulator (plasmid) [Ralstonia solanacearum P673]|uniref:LysR family transcriptional regulator n=1 Tax=Ralstonia solanacearum TaxID=305 RepID=UPI0004AEDDE0|nr:LysR family transcriptional regulator [Ralstonia solanacearum]MCL9848532.1 LysR family transcriptional regulator [Ralstonia solanacearum]MCL9856565.1 LysR family transcriptional regulator [Ralstonia solanacearum]MCL9861230.1 LysR family transcriptional regulator [Ralstonia solanacearum]MCL9862758.1 LysR family transcriptional regulator [Ralstonia solanacearum]MCL9870236.1 LysR family transcriptional regulator [Ralstonia solanacearum]